MKSRKNKLKISADSNKKFFKEDINLLDKPIFVLCRRSKCNVLKIECKNGFYKLSCALGLPDYFDIKVLYFLVYKLYRDSGFNSYTIDTSRFEIAKEVSTKSPGQKQYQAVMKAIEKLRALSICFDGIFYENGHYVTKIFGFLDEADLDYESGLLRIRLNEGFIDQLKKTQFYKFINFEIYKRFTLPAAQRLYELLIKNFAQDSSDITLQTLAEKMGFQKNKGAKRYYPSDILRVLYPAIKEINNFADISVDFKYDAPNQKCFFYVQQKPCDFKPALSLKQTKRSKLSNSTHDEACYEYYLNLPQDERRHIDQSIASNTIYSVVTDDKARVCAYLKNKGIWKKPEN